MVPQKESINIEVFDLESNEKKDTKKINVKIVLSCVLFLTAIIFCFCTEEFNRVISIVGLITAFINILKQCFFKTSLSIKLLLTAFFILFIFLMILKILYMFFIHI